MTVRRHYLDYNATAPLRPEVRAAMMSALDIFGNPSSVHHEGRQAKAAIERARAQVAALAGCEPSEVLFTSGATESNQTVMSAGWDLIAASAMEHESVLAAGVKAQDRKDARFLEIAAFRDGQASVSDFELVLPSFERLGHAMSRRLVSVQMANGETGVVQPVERFVESAREQGYAVHTDAVQAAGRIPVNFASLGVDYMSLSAHKLGGPKGIGALIVRRGLKPGPLINGGGQETGRRSGTENVTGIIGFGVAAECALRDLADMRRIGMLRDRLETAALAACDKADAFCRTPRRLPNTTALALPGAKAETLVIAFDLAGIAVSAGSACSSGKAARSHVLRATNAPDELVESTFRVSLGWDSSEDDIDAFLNVWSSILKQHERRAVA
ncbi:MAG: cysteine desulfurase family protein [Hyphomicrobiales bacterium]